MAGKVGGARPGSGRKKGGKNKRSTRLSDRKAASIITSGLSPLDVLMTNMRFWHTELAAIEPIVRRMADAVKKANVAEAKKKGLPYDDSPASILEISRTGVGKNFFDARDKLQDCAIAAARYVHPPMASIDPPPESDGIDLSKLSDDELDRYLELSRKVSTHFGDPGGNTKA